MTTSTAQFTAIHELRVVLYTHYSKNVYGSSVSERSDGGKPTITD
jgi:hypothetical protein